MAAESRQPQSSAADFAGLLQQSQMQLFGYIHSLVRDLNDADDLFQQVALILWRKFDEFEPGRSFLAWSCGIARLEACNFLRTRGRSRLHFSDQLNLMLLTSQIELTQDESEMRKQALAQCMGKLRPQDRELLTDCYSDDGSVAKVAQREGRSSQSVHNSLRRIRRMLFECVQRNLHQHPGMGGAAT